MVMESCSEASLPIGLVGDYVVSDRTIREKINILNAFIRAKE